MGRTLRRETKIIMYLSRVSIGFGKRVIAQDISFHLEQGRLYCLLGRNGCGKSTLLKTISMLNKPLSGEISYKGQNLATMGRKRLSHTVSIVLTGRADDSQNLSVFDLAAMGRMPYTGFLGILSEKDKTIIRRSLDAAGVLHLSEKPVFTLSDGEYQKVGIAKTLAQETPVVLLDEPTAFLDYASKADLMDTIGQMAHKEGKIVLMSTHDVNLAIHMADSILLMGNGQVQESGGVDDVRRFVGGRISAYL